MNTEENTEVRLGDIILLAGAFLVLLLFGLRTISGADIFFHLAAGRYALANGAASVDPFSFGLSPGTAWIQTSWLYDILVFNMWRVAGSAGVILLHTGAVIGAFLLLIPVARTYSRPLHQAVALLLCTWMFAPVFTVRPMLLCLLFAAVFLNILHRPRLTWIHGILLGATQLIWVNMHPTFMLGLLFVAVRAIEAFVHRREVSAGTTPYRVYAILLVVLAALGCVNPDGPGLYSFVVSKMTRPDSGIILEWVSPFFRDFLPSQPAHLTTAALVLIAAVFIIRRERLPILLTTIAVLSAYLLVQSNRNLDLCALLLFPFLCISISSIAVTIAKKAGDSFRNLLRYAVPVVMAIILAGSAWMILTNRYYVNSGSASSFGLWANYDVMPAAASNVLGRKELRPKRILNIAHDGAYLMWRFPNERVFTDPRGGLYGGQFYDRFAKGLLGQKEQWDELAAVYDPDAILLNAAWTGSGSMVFNLLAGDQWSMAYFDGTSLLLARKTSTNSELLEDKEIQQYGLNQIESSYQRYRQQLGNRFVRPANPARLIGASSIFQALGRHEEALPILEALTIGTPRMFTAWLNRGIAESVLGKHQQAIKTLEYTSTILPSHALVWLWLSNSYKLSGRDTDAARAFEKARLIHPVYAERFQKDVTEAKMKFATPPDP